MRALVLAALLLAACSNDPCNKGTARIEYTLSGADEAADSLDVVLTVGSAAPQTRSLSRKSSDSSVELDFSSYPEGQDVSITLVARENGVAIASGSSMAHPDGGCFSLSIPLSPSADAGVGDLDVGDGGEPLDDFAGQTLPDLSLPAQADLSFAPASAPSCVGLPVNCGSAASDVCCNSPLVPGGSYYRGQDDATDGMYASGPLASVSSFRLDKYETTVGRFRKFLAAGKGTQATAPAAGAGANPYLANTGWQTAWNTNLETSTAALETALSCDAAPDMRQTWTATAGAGEDIAINCVTWYEAFAFCAWDGGFLPTEAEWNYAAAGGSEQRAYEWSNPSSSLTISCSYANYDPGAGGNGEHCVGDMLGGLWAVGSAPKGDARWGQSDMAGNVYEWTLDWKNDYPMPCTDCASLTQGTATYKVNRGGGLFSGLTGLRTSLRGQGTPAGRGVNIGIRCARIP